MSQEQLPHIIVLVEEGMDQNGFKAPSNNGDSFLDVHSPFQSKITPANCLVSEVLSSPMDKPNVVLSQFEIPPPNPTLLDQSNKLSPKKEMFTSAFFIFKKEKLAIFKKSYPNEKISSDFAVNEWKAISNEKKQKYYDQASMEKQELIKSGDFRKTIMSNKKTPEELKESKKIANKLFKQSVRETQIEKDKRFIQLREKYKQILQKKMEKLAKIKEKNETLDFKKKQAEVENTVVKQMVKDREGVLGSLKEKYSVLHKLHKTCSKS